MNPYIKYMFLCLVFILTACGGFHLRGTQKVDMQVSTVAIQPDDQTEYFQRVFRRYLHDTDVTVAPARPDLYVVRLKPENYTREILVIGTDAEAKQEYLIYTIYFEILSPVSGAMGEQSVQVTRMLNLDPSRILGQNQEETVLIAEMREEASMQIYYRLNVVAGREQRESLVKQPVQEKTP